MMRRLLVPALLLLAFTASGARAALFDDDEARKRITELKMQVEERLTAIETTVRDRSIDHAQQIDALKQEIGKLRGQVEVLLNQFEQLDKRQKDLYVDLDNRLRKLEGVATERPAQADPATEKQSYEAALNQLKLGNYQSAIASFQSFMAGYSQSQLVPSAQYWIGNAYYALRDCGVAIASEQKVLSAWPDSAKAPDALIVIANCQSDMGDAKAARETLQSLIKKYPGTTAAEQAKQRLQKR